MRPAPRNAVALLPVAQGVERRAGLTLEQARAAAIASLQAKGQRPQLLYATPQAELYYTPNGRHAAVEIQPGV